MKVGSIGGAFVTAHTKLTHNASSGKTDVNDHYYDAAGGGWVGKSSSSSPPPADAYMWTWLGAAQHSASVSDFGFLSTDAADNYQSQGLTFAANTIDGVDIGVYMTHDGTSTWNMMTGTTYTIQLWDISEEHMMVGPGGKTRTSGPLAGPVTANGDHMTFIYSGVTPSSGLTFGTPAQMYWTQEAVTSTQQTASEYSAVVYADSYNVEGDIHYITHKLKGTTALIDAGSAQLAWEDASSNPRTIEHIPYGWAAPSAGDGGFTFRGAILWDSTTTAKGNTGVTFPIDIEDLVPA
jgi:hypothetical protein